MHSHVHALQHGFLWVGIVLTCRKEFSWAASVDFLRNESLHWTSSWHHTSIKNFLYKMSLSKLQFGGETSIFIKNSWPQWSDNAVFWYQQMLCLTCSLKLYSVLHIFHFQLLSADCGMSCTYPIAMRGNSHLTPPRVMSFTRCLSQ